MPTTNIKSIFFFVLCFSFGLSVFFSISENIDISRDPAAIDGKVFQISSLSNAQIKKHLEQKIKIFPTTEGKKSIQLSGFSSALCKSYSKIELEFQAEGIAVGGAPPTMKISAPCQAGQDPAEMSLLEIPIEMLLKEKPKNSNYSFSGYNTQLEFANSADEWPRQWVLIKVQFFSSEGKNKLIQFGRSIASDGESDRPVVLEF